MNRGFSGSVWTNMSTPLHMYVETHRKFNTCTIYLNPICIYIFQQRPIHRNPLPLIDFFMISMQMLRFAEMYMHFVRTDSYEVDYSYFVSFLKENSLLKCLQTKANLESLYTLFFLKDRKNNYQNGYFGLQIRKVLYC